MRTYVNYSISQLIDAATNNWSDPVTLNALLEETRYRTTKKAASLQRDLVKRISILTGSGSSSDDGSSQQRSSSAHEESSSKFDPKVAAEVGACDPAEFVVLWRWGLSPTADDDLLNHAAKLWRNRLHPDRHPDLSAAERSKLEERLKCFETDLRDVQKLRVARRT